MTSLTIVGNWAIGVDIGGTKVAAGLVDAGGQVRHRRREMTPHRSREPRVVEDLIVDLVTRLLDLAAEDDLTVESVGIGAAGFVTADRARVVFAPHLSWRDEPVQATLQQRLSLPITVDNDANAAGWAESRFGAGRGQSDLVMVNLGTGIGGAHIVGGHLLRGRYGIAGEFGHMQVVPGGHRCECGNRGCWEQYASGNALVREARTLLETQSPVAVDLAAELAVAGASGPQELTGALVTQVARDGDPLCRELLADVGIWLGVGLANLAAALDPGLFVIGGGVSEAGELLLAPARESFARHLVGRGHRPAAQIVPASLGPDAGMIGAADLSRADCPA